MDTMWPLRVHKDVTNGTATPAQPDPQTVHLNAAQSQQQCQEMPLTEAGFCSSQATSLPPTQQPQEEIPLPRAPLFRGAADSSRIQQQRKEIPLPRAGMPAPPLPEIPCPAPAPPSEFPPSAPLSTAPLCIATPHTASCARLLQTADIPPRRLTSFAATIRGLPRTSFSAPMILYRPL